MAEQDDQLPLPIPQVALDNPLSERTFGVEIECVWPSAGRLREGRHSYGTSWLTEKLCAAGFPTGDRARGGWYWGGDNYGDGGSMWDGGELCTPILKAEEGMDYLRRLMSYLRDEIGARVNDNCGMHVHVGVTGLSPLGLRAVVARYARYERFFDALISQYRLHSRFPITEYRADLPEHLTGRSNLLRDYGWSNVPGKPRARDRGYPPGPARDRACLASLWNGPLLPPKGAKPSWRGDTFEFRAHQGSVNPDHAEHWVRLLVAFVDACAAVTTVDPPPRNTTAAFEPETVITQRSFEAFLRLWKLPRRTRKYLAERRIVLLAQPLGDEDMSTQKRAPFYCRYQRREGAPERLSLEAARELVGAA